MIQQESDNMNFCYTVKKQDASISLVEWMKSFNLGKNKINYLIDNSCVVINGEIIKNRSYELKVDDLIIIDTSMYDGIDYPPYRYNLKVLYEDDYILAVYKPAGFIIYPEEKQKAASMANIVAYYYEKTNQDYAVRHCHRLDADTTGVLIFAKDIFTHAKLSFLFEHHQIKKEYYCMCEGVVDKNGVIEAPIGRNRHDSKKMMISDSGDYAKTIYNLVEVVNNISLVKVEIKTGRTHQIRVHMASIKHPIVGDELYGSKILGSRVLLHCTRIGFVHPITKVWVDINSDIPLDFMNV